MQDDPRLSVRSKDYADGGFKLIAFLAIVDAIAGIIGERGFSIGLSIFIALLAIGILWERRDRT